MSKKRNRRTTEASSRPQGDSITVYYGEFLVSPCPLEMSFNYCSHLCSYCFANINKRGRWADVQRTVKLIVERDERDTLEARLLRDKYPVVVSNRTDPFAAANYRQAVPVLRLMASQGIPAAIQTRGGFGIDETLEFLPPSVWYVSVTSLDEAGTKRREPGAPSPAERLALIRTLRERGHEVVIGLNPYVREWVADPKRLAGELAEAGASGAWIGTLHFNHRQVEAMTPREKESLGAELIAKAKKKVTTWRDPDALEMREACIEAGLSVFIDGHSDLTTFWAPWERCYDKLFPTMSEFQWVLDSAGVGEDDLITFDAFANYVDCCVPPGKWQCHHYVGAQAHDALKRRPMPSLTTYREMLAYVWEDERIRFHPVTWPFLKWAGDGRKTIWTDDDGQGYLVYRTEPSDHYIAEYEMDGAEFVYEEA